MSISLKQYKKIVVLTGAGVSAGSGLPTFRSGDNAIWNDPEVLKLSGPDRISSAAQEFWDFWGKLKNKTLEAAPNEAHISLAQWEKHIEPHQQFVLITQNVDNLHQRAGSTDVVELHGSLFRTKCSNEKCSKAMFEDENAYSGQVAICELCSAPLRPDIVLFGEMLPLDAEWKTKKALRDCDLFIAIGTSGKVDPAARFVEWAKYAGAYTVLVNIEKLSTPNKSFDREVIGPAEKVLPLLLK